MMAVHTFKTGINNHAAKCGRTEDVYPGLLCCSDLISLTSIMFAESLLNNVV